MRALLVIAAGLACVIAAEAVADPYASETLAPPAVAVAAVRPGADPTIAVRAMDAAMSRPVMAQSRRPASVADASPDAPAAVGAKLPRLSGIVSGPNGRAAVFSAAADGPGAKPTVAAEGAKIAAWTVRAIGEGQVTLSGPEGERVLRPAFGDGPPSAGPPRAFVAQPAGAPSLQLRGPTDQRAADPRLGRPGLPQPGFPQPGVTQPGVTQPGVTQPGFSQTDSE